MENKNDENIKCVEKYGIPKLNLILVLSCIIYIFYKFVGIIFDIHWAYRFLIAYIITSLIIAGNTHHVRRTEKEEHISSGKPDD